MAKSKLNVMDVPIIPLSSSPLSPGRTKSGCLAVLNFEPTRLPAMLVTSPPASPIEITSLSHESPQNSIRPSRCSTEISTGLTRGYHLMGETLRVLSISKSRLLVIQYRYQDDWCPYAARGRCCVFPFCTLHSAEHIHGSALLPAFLSIVRTPVLLINSRHLSSASASV